ncbi:hypothetical protein J3F83DRAFT_742876 [Trichoderma novae-zelandiae]
MPAIRDDRRHQQQQPPSTAPPSTAPAVMASANESTMPSTTAIGMRFIATFNTYEPGTEMQRSY